MNSDLRTFKAEIKIIHGRFSGASRNAGELEGPKELTRAESEQEAT